MDIRLYTAALITFFCGVCHAQKLSPITSLKIHDSQSQKLKSIDNTTVSAFIRIKSADITEDLKKFGAKTINTISDKLVTAELPLAAIEQISKLDGIESISLGTDVHMRMDEARKQTGVDDCHTMTSNNGPYTGKGVVVGIVDNGFEFAHVDFMNSDLSDTRVKRVWNQSGTGKAPIKYGYGAEYTSLAQMKAAKCDTRSTFHATHVSGIAAGSDKTVPYYGVAPDADLVFVSYRQSNSDIVNGIKYVFDYAKSVGKPAVVNLSLGSHMGPHDGTSDTDVSFAALTGPGRIIVGACGNEGSTKLHVSKTLTTDDNVLMTMLNNDDLGIGNDDPNYVDIWGDKGAVLSAKAVLVDTSTGEIIDQSKEVSTGGITYTGKTMLEDNGTNVYVRLALQQNPNNGRTEITILGEVAQIKAPYAIGIVATSEPGTTIHMWNASEHTFTSKELEGWTDGDSFYTVGEIGGESPDVISVGSFNSKDKYIPYKMAGTGQYMEIDKSLVGDIYDHSLFSSMGPTVDRRIKPDVSAPGSIVISAGSKYVITQANDIVAKNKTDNYVYCIGTSMASPFVTGTVALWLQANPNLTPSKIREIISHTASADQYVGSDTTLPNNIWGYGKIDALAGLKEVLHTTGIKDVEQTYNLFKVMTDRSKHTATFYLGDKNNVAKVDVYNVLGQKVESKTISSDGETIDFSNLAGGVYLFKIEQGNVVKTVKAFI